MLRGLSLLARGAVCQTQANCGHLSRVSVMYVTTTPSDGQDEQDQFGTLQPQYRHKKKQSKKHNSKQITSQGMIQNSPESPNIRDYSYFQNQSKTTSLSDTNEADVFGTLDPQLTQQLKASTGAGGEEEEEKPHIRLSAVGRKNTPVWYGMKIERLGKEGKVSEAEDVLEIEMLQNDRVMPTRYVFTCLIGVLARAGRTQKAFKLYNKMKKMGLSPEKPTYTALFNACANCVDKQDGWKRAEKLRAELVQKNIIPHLTTYKAMIKAYGMCGDLAAAFSLVDEIASHGYAIDGDVFKHLLVACISDTEAGSLHAVQVWQRMQKRQIPPTTGHYNLLLRALRVCGFGDLTALPLSDRDNSDHTMGATVGRHLQHDGRTRVPGRSDETVRVHVEPVFPPSGELISTQPWWQVPDNQLVPVEETKEQYTLKEHISILNSQRTSLLDLKPGRQQDVLRLVQPATPVERLACAGGLMGVLEHMERHRAKPDVRTLTQLLDMLPNKSDAEQDLMSIIGNHGVKPDTDFFNLLIRRRSKRQDYDGAKEVVLHMGRLNLSPNLQTFRALAFGCKHHLDTLQLLQDMKNMDMVPDVQLLCLLMNHSGQDFLVKRHLLVTMETLQILPNERMLRMIEEDISQAEDAVVRKERGEEVQLPKNFDKTYGIFRKYYSQWLQRMRLDASHFPPRANRRQ